eukprot:4248187-Pyramimonas_sp.AAC.1
MFSPSLCVLPRSRCQRGALAREFPANSRAQALSLPRGVSRAMFARATANGLARRLHVPAHGGGIA